MKKFILPILFISFLSACTEPKEPEFKSVNNVKVVEFTDKVVVIDANAVFHNPNPYSVTLQKSDIDVFVNEINVGKAKQIKSSDIAANSEFTMPMQISFPPSKILNDTQGLINIALGALGGKKIDLQYKGSVTLSVLEIPFTVPVDYEDEIKFKKKK
ncbi:MAG: LEA type 2 family protein [Bacteroidia bacterium]|nr:LEA type 2 family protein [Bacteroidia bacterium]